MCLKELFAGDCALVVTNDAWYGRKLQNSLPCLPIFLADDFCLPKGNKSDENYVIVDILIQKQ
jgi:hypothetical protein